MILQFQLQIKSSFLVYDACVCVCVHAPLRGKGAASTSGNMQSSGMVGEKDSESDQKG